jgi:hypothetical protein
VEAAMDDFILFDEFDPNIGVEETVNSAIQIFPNPGGDHLILSASENIGEVQVWDASGRMVEKRLINGLQQEISTSHWPAGIYQVRTQSGYRTRWIKL